MTRGPIAGKFIRFVIPLIITNLMQQFYTLADNAVVGQFAGKAALAAVGATTSSTTLILNLLIGLSIGSSIVNANLLGRGDKDALSRSMHCAIPFALLGGLLVSVVGLFITPLMLDLTKCPENIRHDAIIYMRIIFCGAPGTLLYNVGSGILRTHGDSKRPMYIMAISGLTNVLLNLVFVIVFKMAVVGVALATIISKYLSATCVILTLVNPKNGYNMQLRNMKLRKKEAWEILRVGIPCGINSTVFHFANTIVQTGVNQLGDTVIAGGVAASNTVNLIYQVEAAIYTGCINFVGQSFGAGKYRRIDKIAGFALGLCLTFTIIAATLITFIPHVFISIFNTDPEVIDSGVQKLVLMAWSYVLYGISEVLMGSLRGMKQTAIPSLINMFCICGVRVAWILFILPFDPTNQLFLYSCYPISYILSILAIGSFFLHFRKKIHAQSQVHVA